MEQERIVSVRPCWNLRNEPLSYVAAGFPYNLQGEKPPKSVFPILTQTVFAEGGSASQAMFTQGVASLDPSRNSCVLTPQRLKNKVRFHE